MLSIPQRLTAPFLGDEAKLAFRSHPGGISKLANTRHISEMDSYWDQYVLVFDSASDVFTLITPHDIRRALSEAPENVSTLVRVITSRLFNLVSDHTFPSSSNSASSVTAFASSFMKSGRNTTKEALNCVRILQRVLPVIFEAEGDSSVFETELFWKKAEVRPDREDSSSSPQFVIEDEDESEEEGGDSAGRSGRQPSSSEPPVQLLPSLGDRLLSCIIDLLFCCGFTLPTKIQVDHYKINYVIWEKGVGSATDPGPSQAYESNKTEVLRLLLVLLSRQIYIPPSSLLSNPSMYTLHFTQNTPRRNVLTVLCSLLNTGMNATHSGGVTIGSMAGKLPYNHLVFKGEDHRSSLVGISLQVLCVLLDFQSGSARDVQTVNGDTQTSGPTLKTNAFRYFLAKLHRSQDFAFILEGVMGILAIEIGGMGNMLPGARKPVPYLPETVIFLWKMIELNKKFRIYALESEHATDLVAYLLCYCLDIKDKPQQHGVCRALSYIIQTLSAETAFGLKLSNPVKAYVPSKWAFGGTAGDFLINAVYSIVATTSGALNSIYPALIISLSNAAPYFKNLTVTSSARLTQLFNSFANPPFLLADEGHPRLLFFLLETFNSVVLHHLSENPNLVYAILGTHKSFENLGTFTLARGLREVRRIQAAKEAQNRNGNVNTKPVGVEEEEEQPENEKARLLNSTSPDSNSSTTPTNEEEDQTTVAITSPPTSPPPTGDSTSPLPNATVSEKARGKMKARRSLSVDTNSSLDRISAAGVGRNGFVPTQEWVTSWQQGLPLDPVMLLISELLPKIQAMQAGGQKASSTTTIMSFLSTVTLKHILPPTPPINPRRFLWSDSSIIWLTSLIWGEIFVRGMTPLGIWNSTNVRLFYVKHAQVPQRPLTDAVSNVVGGLWGRSNSSSEVPQTGR